MSNIIAIRRETKSPWERRVPVTPQLARRLIEGSGIEVLVQSSARRIFRDKEYVRSGAVVTSNISDAKVVLGVKEIPVESLSPNTVYVIFSHVIKGQRPNMPMLRRLMELGCTLIDYERVTDADGSRMIFFGHHAGLAGAVDMLWALGQRFDWEGIHTPFQLIQPTHTYDSLDEARHAVRQVGSAIASKGLPREVVPLVVGIAGYGNVAGGVREILSELPTRELKPAELGGIGAEPSNRALILTTFREEHLVEPASPDHEFELQDYYDHPELYRGAFARFFPELTVITNCIYWESRYPRLVTKADLRSLYRTGPGRLRVIADLGCDVEGAVECTSETSEPGSPVYVWDPETDTIRHGVEGDGPVVLAVDILPAELPLEASEEFSRALAPFIPALASADFDAPFESLALPDSILRAVIVHRGELTPEYEYLQQKIGS